MKKEEIDDRLMDALLRGECEEDLAVLVTAGREPRFRFIFWKKSLTAIAAMMILGVSCASLWNYWQTEIQLEDQKTTAEEPPIATADSLNSLAIEIKKQEDKVAAKRKLLAIINDGKSRPYFESEISSTVLGRVRSSVREACFSRQFDDPDGRQVVENNPERYGELVDQPWMVTAREPLSTFSVDVDTASYTNVRSLLKKGSEVPKDAVRIEELVNYFAYSYPQPGGGEAFGVGLAMATCPWEEKHNLVRVALQGKEIPAAERGDANLVFLVDVSGSMRDSDKLPLLLESLTLLLEELRENDRIALVVYAGSEGVVLEPTKMGQGGRETVRKALGNLSAGGSTNGGAGIELAYQLAQKHFVKGGVNRVILATDGDFNVGTTNQEALVKLVKGKAADGVFLSVCGFGRGNLNDALLESITNEGNGVYYYIDSIKEARRVFLEKLMGTLVTIAKDVKIQVEFNPSKVANYRLIGYANRILKKEDFNDDRVDAGDIGSGHQVTAFYEIVPVGVRGTIQLPVDELKYGEKESQPRANDSPDWMTVKLRHKLPEETESKRQDFVLRGEARPWQEMDADFRFAAGVALWGMSLRGVENGEDLAESLISEASNASGDRLELKQLLKRQRF